MVKSLAQSVRDKEVPGLSPAAVNFLSPTCLIFRVNSIQGQKLTTECK